MEAGFSRYSMFMGDLEMQGTQDASLNYKISLSLNKRAQAFCMK
jgi:hypothetical protein